MSENKRKKSKRSFHPTQTPRMHVINWLLLLIGVVVIGFGFLSLSKGSITLAPILLVVGYCVIIPIALLFKPRMWNNNA